MYQPGYNGSIKKSAKSFEARFTISHKSIERPQYEAAIAVD
jgi:hypothetical protein